MPRLLTPAQKQELLVQRVSFTTSAPSALDDRQVELADSLSRLHGTIRVAREEGGLHFYMASPVCLERDGRIELTKMHLAVNVDKYLKGKDRAAMCMKTGQPYRVSKLLKMPALVDRGIADAVAKVQMAETNRDYLEQDTAGNWIPKSPGKVIPIYELPQDHPAIYYLQSRGFDPNALWHQFRLSYCYEERNDIFYRRLLNGFNCLRPLERKCNSEGHLWHLWHLRPDVARGLLLHHFLLSGDSCGRRWECRGNWPIGNAGGRFSQKS